MVREGGGRRRSLNLDVRGPPQTYKLTAKMGFHYVNRTVGDQWVTSSPVYWMRDGHNMAGCPCSVHQCLAAEGDQPEGDQCDPQGDQRVAMKQNQMMITRSYKKLLQLDGSL